MKRLNKGWLGVCLIAGTLIGLIATQYIEHGIEATHLAMLRCLLMFAEIIPLLLLIAVIVISGRLIMGDLIERTYENDAD